MTLEELFSVLNQANIPVRYSHFTEDIEPPYMVYIVDGKNTFLADNKVFNKNLSIRLELYTNEKDLELEERIEQILNDNDLVWEDDNTYDSKERLYVAYYYFEI